MKYEKGNDGTKLIGTIKSELNPNVLLIIRLANPINGKINANDKNKANKPTVKFSFK